MPGRVFKRPCERCGVDCTAQFCRDCRLVDKPLTAGGRNTDDQQKYLSHQRAIFENDEFWSAVNQASSNGQRKRTVKEKA